jgi:uncharacterized protein YndB with AHSA1/START domain
MTETVVLERDYPYPAARLLRAWTDIQLVGLWFGCGPGMLWTVHEWDARVGGRIHVSLTFSSGPFEVVGTFVIVEPPHRLRYEWRNGQVVDVTIEDRPSGSRLTVVHSGLSEMEFGVVSSGWDFGLGELGRAPQLRGAVR